MSLEGVTIRCFGASYAVALAVELARLFWPRAFLRAIAVVFACAGVLAQTLFLCFHRPALSSSFSSMLFLSWILAVFYAYGTVHHRRLAWGIFVLPVVLGLVTAAAMDPASQTSFAEAGSVPSQPIYQFWHLLHYGLLLLAAVGICVGFVASLMYLFQMQQLKSKVLPGQRLRLLSLERLELMNRRAINLAFPLLTAGVLVGIALMVGNEQSAAKEARDPRILATVVLWVVFAILLFLRHGRQLRGRRVAYLTIMAFLLLLITLAAGHSSVAGGRP